MFFQSYAPAVLLGMIAVIALIWRSVFRPSPPTVVVRRALFVIYAAVLFGFSFLPWPTASEVPLRWAEIFQRADLVPLIPSIDRGIDAAQEFQLGYRASMMNYIYDLFLYFVLLMPLAYFLRRESRSLHSLFVWLMTFFVAVGIELLQLVLNELSGVYYQHVSTDQVILQTLGAGFLLLVMSVIRAIYLKRKGYSLIRNPEREFERLRDRAKLGERRGELITKDTHWH